MQATPPEQPGPPRGESRLPLIIAAVVAVALVAGLLIGVALAHRGSTGTSVATAGGTGAALTPQPSPSATPSPTPTATPVPSIAPPTASAPVCPPAPDATPVSWGHPLGSPAPVQSGYHQVLDVTGTGSGRVPCGSARFLVTDNWVLGSAHTCPPGTARSPFATTVTYTEVPLSGPPPDPPVTVSGDWSDSGATLMPHGGNYQLDVQTESPQCQWHITVSTQG